MKRIFTLMNLTMLMTASLMMTSCMDDDTAESITLSGQWTGNFGMFYDYEYRGQIYTFNSYDTDIVFYPDYNYATHGYGYEVDFYNEGPRTKMSFRFFWEINRGNIYLDYPGYPEYNTIIRDYSLSSYYFTGYFENSTQQFRLRKLADFYNWNDYSGYDYHYWDDPYWNWNSYYPYYPYYAKERGGMEEMNDSADADSGRIVRIGHNLASLGVKSEK